MSSNMTFDQFKAMVSEYLGLDKENLTWDTSFITDLGIDSLSLVNFIIRVERDYDIKFQNENGFMLRTLGEAYEIFINSFNQKKSEE